MVKQNLTLSVQALLDGVEKLLGNLGTLILAVMGVIVALQIFFRVAPINYQGVWTTEIARFLLVFMTLTGIPYAMRRRNHISIRPLLRILSDSTQRYLLTFSNVLVIVMCFVAALSGISVLDQTMVQSLPTVGWLKVGHLTLYLVGAFALSIVFIIEKIVMNVKGNTTEVEHRGVAND